MTGNYKINKPKLSPNKKSIYLSKQTLIKFDHIDGPKKIRKMSNEVISNIASSLLSSDNEDDRIIEKPSLWDSS